MFIDSYSGDNNSGDTKRSIWFSMQLRCSRSTFVLFFPFFIHSSNQFNELSLNFALLIGWAICIVAKHDLCVFLLFLLLFLFLFWAKMCALCLVAITKNSPVWIIFYFYWKRSVKDVNAFAELCDAMRMIRCDPIRWMNECKFVSLHNPSWDDKCDWLLQCAHINKAKAKT